MWRPHEHADQRLPPPTAAELELATYRTTLASLICLLVEGPEVIGPAATVRAALDEIRRLRFDTFHTPTERPCPTLSSPSAP